MVRAAHNATQTPAPCKHAERCNAGIAQGRKGELLRSDARLNIAFQEA